MTDVEQLQSRFDELDKLSGRTVRLYLAEGGVLCRIERIDLKERLLLADGGRRFDILAIERVDYAAVTT